MFRLEGQRTERIRKGLESGRVARQAVRVDVWRTRSQSDGTLSLTVIAINGDQDYFKNKNNKTKFKMADLLTAEGRSNRMRPKICQSPTQESDRPRDGRRRQERVWQTNVREAMRVRRMISARRAMKNGRHAVCNLPTKFISNGVAFDGRGKEGWDKRSERALFPFSQLCYFHASFLRPLSN